MDFYRHTVYGLQKILKGDQFMVTTMDIRAFIKEAAYIDLLNQAIAEISLDIDENPPSTQDFNIDAERVNKSGIALEEFLKICVVDKDDIIKFAGLLYTSKFDDEIDVEDDYYEEDNDQQLDEEPIVQPATILMTPLIYCYFLKYRPDGLESFLKRLRVPNYKIVSEQFRMLYSKI